LTFGICPSSFLPRVAGAVVVVSCFFDFVSIAADMVAVAVDSFGRLFGS
jgi:hypothetical protein